MITKTLTLSDLVEQLVTVQMVLCTTKSEALVTELRELKTELKTRLDTYEKKRK